MPPTDVLAELGPLGCANQKRQIGLGAKLGPGQVNGLRARLIETSSREFNDGLSQAVTITCGVGPDSRDVTQVPLNTRRYRLEGVLKWGAQGAQTVARFDWLQGVTVRPVGGAFFLDCEMLPALTLGAVDASAFAEVTAHAGYSSNSCRAATLTRRGVDAGGAGVSFDVPPFAVRVQLLFTGGGASISWRLIDNSVLAGPITALGSFENGWAGVPNGAANLLAVPTVAGSAIVAIWELSL